MKHSITILTILLISYRLLAQNYGLDNADPALFTKYRIPETNLSTFYFNTQVNFNSSQKDNYTSIPYNEFLNNTYSYFFNSSLSPNYYLLKENDDRVLDFNIYANGSYINRYNKSNYSIDTINSYEKERELNAYLNIDFNYKKYLHESDLFYSIGSKSSIEISDQRKEGTYVNNLRLYEGTKNQDYNILFGIGWGKIRNVSPVVSAIRFQERLKQLNIINSNLNEKTIEDLAEQLSKEMYYSTVYNRSGKYLWDDIEKSLSRNGISLSGLNQYGSYYLKEISSEIRFQRNEGLSTGLNFQFNYNNFFYSNYIDKINEQYYSLGNVYLNCSHQLNLNSQINFNLSLSGGPNLSKHPHYRQKYLINSEVGYNYELTDRLVTSISDKFSLSFINLSDGQIKELRNDLQLRANYFIEDKISLNMAYLLSYAKFQYPLASNSELDDIFSIGLTYYIDKGFLYK
jgi:hypothetical protein